MRRLLALVEAPDHVCCRYRVRAFAPALAAAGWSLDLLALARHPAVRAAQLWRAADADAVLLQRRLLPPWQLAILRRRARRLIFDFDDAVLYRDSYDRRGPNSARRLGRFKQTVRHADVVLAGNGFLADCAVEAGAARSRVRVLPTCIETDRYADLPRRPPARDGIDLVWVGSSSTLKGLEHRRDLWERLGREVPGLKLRVVCDRFPRFDALPTVDVPWSEATEVAAIAAGDVGISWIPDDVWSRGKCGLKLLQYQAAGLPVVTNPVGVHPELVVSGHNGFLADGDDAWVDAIRKLSEAGLRSRMGEAARKFVEGSYSVAARSGAFVAAVAGPVAVGRRPATGLRATAHAGLEGGEAA